MELQGIQERKYKLGHALAGIQRWLCWLVAQAVPSQIRGEDSEATLHQCWKQTAETVRTSTPTVQQDYGVRALAGFYQAHPFAAGKNH
jgi:hypothetical protein